MTIDFGRPFTFLFEDKDWMMKLLMAGLYMIGALFCGIGAFALMGYMKRLIQAVADGQDVPAPEIGFDRIGEDIVEGLKIFLIYVVYMLPAFFVNLCGGTISNVMMQQGGDAADVGAILSIGTSCLAFPLNLLGQFLAPVGVIRFADGNRLGAAFSFGEVFGFVRRYFVNVLLVFVIGLAAGIVAGFSILLLCIGIFWGIAWTMLVRGHAMGQLLKIGRAENALVGTR